ncbi:hypothetical protein EV2_012457 [Malus domestica]
MVASCVLGTNTKVMDSISQLQEKVNTIATIAFTTIGTLQWDVPESPPITQKPDPYWLRISIPIRTQL